MLGVLSRPMRDHDLFLVVIRLKLLVRDLTSPLVTNEQSLLTEEPIQGRRSIENPEDQEHWVLTRRDPRPVHGGCFVSSGFRHQFLRLVGSSYNVFAPIG